jgi:hypothetical protein
MSYTTSTTVVHIKPEGTEIHSPTLGSIKLFPNEITVDFVSSSGDRWSIPFSEMLDEYMLCMESNDV